jgi:hypothetical protein
VCIAVGQCWRAPDLALKTPSYARISTRGKTPCFSVNIGLAGHSSCWSVPLSYICAYLSYTRTLQAPPEDKLEGWPTVSPRLPRLPTSAYSTSENSSTVQNFAITIGKPIIHRTVGCICRPSQPQTSTSDRRLQTASEHCLHQWGVKPTVSWPPPGTPHVAIDMPC